MDNLKQHRMTKQKQIILDIAKSHCDHPTADQIYLEVHAKDARISRGTVYRDLEQLSELGYILHVKVPGADRYDSRLDLHYHMICMECGIVLDAPLKYHRDADQDLHESSGFEVIRHRTIFEGYCPECIIRRRDNKIQ